MIDRCLQWIAVEARQRYLRLLTIVALLVVVALAMLPRLRFDSDMLNLLPQDEPRVRTFRETLESFGGLDLLLVVLRLPEDTPPGPYEQFAMELGPRLAELEELDYVDFRVGEIDELVESYLPQSLLFLDAEERERLAAAGSDENIDRRVAEIRRLLATPQSVGMKTLVKLDPLGLSEIFIGHLLGGRGATRVDFSSGFFLSADKRLLLLLAKPTQPAQEIDFTTRLVERVNVVVEETLAGWPEIVGEGGPPPPEVALGGNYMTALGDAGTIRSDLIVNIASSMIGVLLLFLFAFRRLGLLIYAFTPLAIGLVMTFAFTAATFGSLNPASGAFAALLIGLGIDFVIVSYGRYVEERARGVGILEGLRRMLGSSGRAVVVGGITSAATFFAFGITKFRGLREMGFLTGVGILFCMVAVLFVLPSMLAWSEDRHARRERDPTLFLHGFGSAGLIRYCVHHPRSVLAAGAVITVASVVGVSSLRFEDSIREMRPQGTAAAAVEAEVAEHFGSGFDFMMLVVSAPDGADGDDFEAVLRKTDEAVAAAETLVDGRNLVNVESILTLLPPRYRQEEVLAWLATERRSRLDVDRIRARFAAAAAREGLRTEPFAEGFDLLARAVAVDEPITLDSLPVDDASRRILERYVRRVGGEWKSIVYLHPPPQTWKRDPPPALVELAAGLGPDVVLSGVNVVSAYMRATVKQDAILAAVVGFVAVALLLWADFKRPLDTLMSLVPLCIGLLWMLGAMSFLDMPMNFFNIFVSTMIIGIGVDYGIHMVHRYRESRGQPIESLERSLCETGKAVVLAALSTMVGFGSLSLSHYPGLRSMGMVAILGAALTALVATTLLPAYLGLRLRQEIAAAENSA